MSLHIMIMVDGVNKYTKLMTISFLDCKKYYKELPHQVEAVTYLGEILLKTPARARLGLSTPVSWISISDEHLIWLQRQISPKTINKFASLWRNKYKKQVEYYSQRDNKTLPYTSCNSSSHAMFVDFILENVLGKPGLGGDDEYVRRVYSGKYGRYGKNNSVSWDVQVRVVRSFGVRARYSNKGKAALIYQLTKRGLVAPANFRHKGGINSSYGGHVVLITDYDKKKGFLIYDPFGTRMPDYKIKNKGIYWMSEREFNKRWQGLFTEYLGKV